MADVIDLDANSIATRPVSETLSLDYPALPWVASLQDPQAETLLPLRSLGPQVKPERLVLTFDNLLQRTDFVPLMRRALATLSRHYEQPVDLEFAATLVPPPSGNGRPEVRENAGYGRTGAGTRASAAAMRRLASANTGPANPSFNSIVRIAPGSKMSLIRSCRSSTTAWPAST